jgi:hypothetical protein
MVAAASSSVVREKQVRAARRQFGKELFLFIDQQLGEAVVTHGDGQMYPRRAWHEIGAEEELRPDAGYARVKHAWRVAVAESEGEPITEQPSRVARLIDDLEATRVFEQIRKAGDERRAVAGVRVFGALPRGASHDEARALEDELGGFALRIDRISASQVVAELK